MALSPVDLFSPPVSRLEKQKQRIFRRVNDLMLMTVLGYFVLSVLLGFVYDRLEAGLSAGFGLMILYFGGRWFARTQSAVQYFSVFVMSLYLSFYMWIGRGDVSLYLVYFFSLSLLALYQRWGLLLIYAGYSITVFLLPQLLWSLGYERLVEAVLDESAVLAKRELLWFMAFSGLHLLIMLWITYTLRRQSDRVAILELYLEDQLNIEANTELARQIAAGDLEGQYDLRENDALGKALLEMRRSLQAARHTEERLAWSNQAVSLINQTLIGRYDSQRMLDEILRILVSYFKAQHGGLFLVEHYGDEQADLILQHCYAGDQRMASEGRFAPGEGIVGECALRRRVMLIKDLPQDFVYIHSGLGQAKPTCLLLIPLQVNDRVLGVLELASLHVFEAHEVELLEKLSANISASLLSLFASRHTEYLLEESRRVNELMKAQSISLQEQIEANEEVRRQMEQKQRELIKSQRQMEDLLEDAEIQNRMLTLSEKALRQNMEDSLAMQRELLEQQKQLVINEAYSKAFFEGSQDAILAINSKGYFIDLNPAASKLFGLQKSAATEKQRVNDFFVTSLELEEVQHAMHKIKDTKGHVFDVLIQVQEVWLDDDKIYVFYLRNLTTQLEQERQLGEMVIGLRRQLDQAREELARLGGSKA